MGSSEANHEMQGIPISPQQPMTGNQQLALSTITTPAAKKWKPKKLFAALRSLFHFLSLPTSPCRLPSLPGGPSEFPPLGNRVMGTLFGYRKGHVHLAVQENPKDPPILFLELATPTSALVKEMASGLVRIALECDKTAGRGKLLQEPVWTMYCNGRKTGYGMKKVCSETDTEVLDLLHAVSMGAGVLPTKIEGAEGELMYMRARFERVHRIQGL